MIRTGFEVYGKREEKTNIPCSWLWRTASSILIPAGISHFHYVSYIRLCRVSAALWPQVNTSFGPHFLQPLSSALGRL